MLSKEGQPGGKFRSNTIQLSPRIQNKQHNIEENTRGSSVNANKRKHITYRKTELVKK